MVLSDNHKIHSFNHLRVIPYNKYPGKLNMAIDYYFASVCHQDSMPILRFYGWKPYCLSIGYHQNKDLIDIIKLTRDGYNLVKRPTGGRAILHAEELTYSIIFPKNMTDHHNLYLFIHRIFAKSLNDMGYPVELKSDLDKLPLLKHEADDYPCFTRSAQSEVQFESKKIIGSAQKIYKKSILQHGSILIGKEHARLPQYLLASQLTKDLMNKEISEKTIFLKAIGKSDISLELLITNIINQLEKIKNISLNFNPIEHAELQGAEKYINSFSLH